MNDRTLSADELQRIFEQRVQPVVFPHDPADQPELIVLTGQPGTGAARLTARLVGRRDFAVVRAKDLRAFHPQYGELAPARTSEAERRLREAASAWTTSALRYARTTGRSLVLDGDELRTPDVVLASTELFARDGFETTISIVAVPRPESLLATVSGHLSTLPAGRSQPFTVAADHDGGLDHVRGLIRALEDSASVDRLSIFDRDGEQVFSGARTDSFAGASEAFDRARQVALTAPQSMRWLSELRAISDSALSGRRISAPLANVLIELHQVALQEVLPRLPLPEDSEARPAAEASIGRRLVAIRKAAVPDQPRDTLPAPAPAPAADPDRGISI
ncbi:MAG: zeta toxin family protein [Microbacterium sp.]|uniref:zeta toxin family protein n=1 Tax=Microbacterium sp. TaxID=51671 RepID=UPI003F80C10D